MRKIFSIIYLGLLITFLGIPFLGLAIEITNPLNVNSFEALIGGVSGFIFKIAMALVPVMLVIAGFMYVISAGDPKRIQTAQKIALYTVIGLVIILLASGLIKVLESILGVTGT